MIEENNKMVMKKIEDGPYEESNLQVKTAVKSGDAIVMNDEANNPPVANPNDTTMVSNKTTGVVSVFAPEDSREVKAEMEEISYEDYIKSKQVGLTSPNMTEAKSATQRVHDLVGKTAENARSVLEDMANKKQVASFRFIPIGMPMSMELEPGRVQVVCDASKKVIDVSIS
jgi:hypothetical protein